MAAMEASANRTAGPAAAASGTAMIAGKLLLLLSMTAATMALALGPVAVDALRTATPIFARTAAALRQSATSSSSYPPPPAAAAILKEARANTTFCPVFDFRDPRTVDCIERLDDVIMGGVSTSQVMADAGTGIEGGGFAKWFGVCRTDGGGFCGFRTLPFREPLEVPNAEGLYMVCRLSSDTDSDRRSWKVSTRTRPDRGELLYQSPLSFRQVGDDWNLVLLPFDSFQLVRGPRMVPNGPPIDVSKGLYQVGMTMSKFKFGENMTVLENFRDGFFQFDIQEIGSYYQGGGSLVAATVGELKAKEPQVLTKEEAKKRQPMVLKLLLPLLNIFFAEKISRRKSAMRILTQKRGLSRLQAIKFGLRSRARSFGYPRSVARTAAIVVGDALRSFTRAPFLLLRRVVARRIFVAVMMTNRRIRASRYLKKKRKREKEAAALGKSPNSTEEVDK